MSAQERATLAEAIDAWAEQVDGVLSILADTFDRDQSKIPLLVENWLSRILDQMNTDTDVRNEGKRSAMKNLCGVHAILINSLESTKLHNSMASWFVNLLVQGGMSITGRNVEADVDLQHLHHEIRTFNSVLLKDADEGELLADENADLRKVLL